MTHPRSRGQEAGIHTHSGHTHHHHAHGPGHPHDGAMRAAVRRRPLWIALAIGSVFIVVEVVGALVTGSLALLADAGHMAADVGAIGLGLFAFWISGRPATPERTFGYLRVEILAAALTAATLVAVSLLIF